MCTNGTRGSPLSIGARRSRWAYFCANSSRKVPHRKTIFLSLWPLAVSNGRELYTEHARRFMLRHVVLFRRALDPRTIVCMKLFLQRRPPFFLPLLHPEQRIRGRLHRS